MSLRLRLCVIIHSHQIQALEKEMHQFVFSKLEKVPLGRIDLSRDRFRISWNRCISDLVESIQKIGCVEPILLWGEPGAEEIVSGFRRTEAAIEAKLPAIPGRWIREPGDDSALFSLALDLFLSTTRPHPVEKAIILCKLQRWHSKEAILQTFMPGLGLNSSAVILDRYLAINKLPDSAREGLSDGRLDPASAPGLLKFEGEDQHAASDLLLALSPSKSAQKEILEYLHDLSMRDEVPVRSLLQQSEVVSILEGKRLNLPQKREAFRRWLRAKRFPVLTQVERNFQKTKKRLRLPEGVNLVPPPYYEGQRFEIRFAFENVDDFSESTWALNEIAESPELLERLWREPEEE